MEEGLEAYYSGDDSWYDWVKMTTEDYWKETKEQLELLNLLKGKKDLAAVIYGRHQLYSLKWIHEKIPALSNITPLECLEHPCLILRLRECLMRMP